MSILDGYATSKERDYDDAIEAHRNGECLEDCPVCIEEAYQRDMWERLEDKRKEMPWPYEKCPRCGAGVALGVHCLNCAIGKPKDEAAKIMAKFDGLIELFKK